MLQVKSWRCLGMCLSNASHWPARPGKSELMLLLSTLPSVHADISAVAFHVDILFTWFSRPKSLVQVLGTCSRSFGRDRCNKSTSGNRPMNGPKVKRAVNGPELFACWEQCEEVPLYRSLSTSKSESPVYEQKRDWVAKKMWRLKDLISFSSAVSAWNLLAIAEQLRRLQFLISSQLCQWCVLCQQTARKQGEKLGQWRQVLELVSSMQMTSLSRLNVAGVHCVHFDFESEEICCSVGCSGNGALLFPSWFLCPLTRFYLRSQSHHIQCGDRSLRKGSYPFLYRWFEAYRTFTCICCRVLIVQRASIGIYWM